MAARDAEIEPEEMVALAAVPRGLPIAAVAALARAVDEAFPGCLPRPRDGFAFELVAPRSTVFRGGAT